jgi:fatty-acyl-CoA synthase
MMMQKSFFIPDWLDRRALYTPDRTAIHDTATNADITYQQWNMRANQTAHFLVDQLGVQKGDRVAVYATNSMAYLDIWMACGKVGAILQNLNWRLKVPELEHLLRDTEPVTIFYSAEFIDEVNQLREPLKDIIAHWVAIEKPATPEDHSFSTRDTAPNTFASQEIVSPDDPWVICYTGGTTGLPKGAILTHSNMAWNAINTVSSWQLDIDDVAILNAPLFHTGGLNVFTLPLISIGGKSILCKSFDVDQVFDLVTNGDVTVFFGVPTMFVMMQQSPRWPEADFSRLKIVISGGGPCPMPIFEKFWERGVNFKTGYGLTEAGPNTFLLPEKDIQRKPGFVGFPLMHIDVKTIRPEDGAPCTANEVGELVIRGPHVTPGYWNMPEETAKAIRDGWLHTGDLAVYDDEGYFKIVGRLKDMIISGGENIYPAEVESVMHAHPAVAEAALIGIPDDKWGEVGRAVVVCAEGQQLEPDDLIAFMRERLASYKIPKSVVFVDAIPRTGPGKIDKKLLHQQYSTI